MRSRLVIDSSVALAWSLDDERSDQADAVLRVVEATGALVPTLWLYEVANILALAVRRKRVDAKRAADISTALEALVITPVPPSAPNWRIETTALAAKYSLTIYDAAYLHLAVVADARLATLDRALLVAASAEGRVFAP